MTQLVLLTGFLASKPEANSTADDRQAATRFQLRVPDGNLWHARSFLESANRVVLGLEIGAPLSVAGLFHIEVFREPKVKLRYTVEVRQVIALRPAAPAPRADEEANCDRRPVKSPRSFSPIPRGSPIANALGCGSGAFPTSAWRRIRRFARPARSGSRVSSLARSFSISPLTATRARRPPSS